MEILLGERNSYSKKLFKSGRVMRDYNEKIKKEQSRLYKMIIRWYMSLPRDIIGAKEKLSFYNVEEFKTTYNNIVEDINKSEEEIQKLKERLKKAIEERNEKINNIATHKERVANRINELTGVQVKEEKIKETSVDENKNVDMMASIFSNNMQNELIEKVEQEAKNQADLREAEIRNISKEELIEMRNQLLENEQKEVHTENKTR